MRIVNRAALPRLRGAIINRDPQEDSSFFLISAINYWDTRQIIFGICGERRIQYINISVE